VAEKSADKVTTSSCQGGEAGWCDPNAPVRPSLLVTGSLHDPRVLIHEPAKWVARLRATAAPGSRLLFRPELGAGAHVGPAGRYDQLRYEAEILAFILDEAGQRDLLPGRPWLRVPACSTAHWSGDR
jgi:hypothetical protein